MARSGKPFRARNVLASVFLALVAVWVVPTISVASETARSCSPIIARIVSLQGSVQLRRGNQQDWRAATRLDEPLCQGDAIRTGPRSRAALVILPEKFVRIDQNSTLSIGIAGDETIVEFLPNEAASSATAGKPSGGAGYFITRFPKKFKVRTPFLNAAVEGTEFLVGLSSSSATVTVFEGKVSAESMLASAERFILNTGETVSSGPGEPAAVRILVKPTDAVQWALYYPPLSEPSAGAGPDQRCSAGGTEERGRCLILRAEQHLRVGRVDDAQSDIEAARALIPHSADADALAAVISVVKNDKSTALALGKRATELDPLSPRAWIAYSYAQQASFRLEDALASAERAAELAPHSSTALTRVAELLMSLGRIRSAERAAQASVDGNSNESRAHTVLGFVHLAQINTSKARNDFLAAIERDSSDPLPRLGLGLATIRDGDLVAGREQIEIAVTLDPTNSLIRSYVGKAYYEENTKERDQLASTQFGMAKQLDPKDPTPWFYDAILKQTQNQPVDALLDLQKSIELNNNRAVYRSNLLLDQDRASRSSSLALIYQDAGFDQLAIAEANRSLIVDPHSYASHSFLAEAYERLPRRELARESEQLQALLRAPIGIVPVSPFREVATPFSSSIPRAIVARSVTPLRSSFNSYEPLYERPGLSLFADAVAASQDTLATQAILAGTGENVGFSAGYGHFRTDGFGSDRDLTQDGANLFAQVRATDQLHLQMEFVEANIDRGTVDFDFDPTSRRIARVQDNSTTARVGGRYEIDPKSMLFINTAVQMFSQQVTDEFGPSRTFGDALAGEAQYSFAGRNLGLVTGISHLNATVKTPVAPDLPTDSNFDSAYIYGRLSDEAGRAGFHLGLNVLTLKNLDERLTQTSPKAGAFLSPVPGTTLRFAMFQTVRRQLISNETLEPTQFAGFNQFWDDPLGSISWQQGIGVDQRFGQKTYAGAEIVSREVETPLFLLPGVSFFTWRENAARAYLYHAIPRLDHSAAFPGWSFALSAEYLYEEVERPENLALNGVVNLRTHTIPLAITAFPNSSLSLRVGVTYLNRSGLLQVFPGFNRVDAGNEAWFGDVVLTYKLPRRQGRISVGVTNLTDERVRIIDSNAAVLPVSPEQVVFARISLAF